MREKKVGVHNYPRLLATFVFVRMEEVFGDPMQLSEDQGSEEQRAGALGPESVLHDPPSDPVQDFTHQARRWCLTINNYACDTDGYPQFWTDVRNEGRIASFVSGAEYGLETHTPHLQCYFETVSTRGHSIRAMLKWHCFAAEKNLGHSVRLEQAHGTAAENIVYCCKDDEFAIKWGPFNAPGSQHRQGARTDWHGVHELAKRGAPDAEFAEQFPHLAYPHVGKIKAWKQLHHTEKRSWKTKPVIYFGPTRVGKSTTMRSEAARLAAANNWRIYTKSDSDKWWPDYNGEEIVLIDEMHGGFFQYQTLLRLFEEGAFTVQYKGGSSEFLGRVIFMTCNNHPATWYKDHTWDDSDPFRARVAEFGELHVFPPRTASMRAAGTFPVPVLDLLLEPPATGANGRSHQLAVQD